MSYLPEWLGLDLRQIYHKNISTVLWAKIHVGDPDPDQIRSGSTVNGQIKILERAMAVGA
jgi:hypothetical protein